MSINQSAPVISRAQIVIDAPVQRVWDIQTDVTSWPLWQPGVESVTADGPFVPGGQFRWRTAGLDITSTIEDVQPLERIQWGGPANGIVAVHVWRFEPTPDGVMVRTEESWEGAPIDANPEPMQRALDASLVEWLGLLKDRAENG